MKLRNKILLVLLGLVLLALLAFHPILPGRPGFALARSLDQVARIIEPPRGDGPRTLTTQLKVLEARGDAADLSGRTLELAFQAPDRLQVSGEIDRARYTIGR